MKRAPSDTPNLDDVLARDFAELKVGEANLEAVPEAPASEAPASESEQGGSTMPQVYNQRINAVEDREAFSVKAPKTKASEEEGETAEKPVPTVLKAPSSQPGDDFDVDW